MIRRRRLLGDESGVTLAELLVVMMLFGVMTVLILSTTVSALKAQQRTVTRGTAMADQKLAFQKMTRSLRQANPLYTATPTSLSFKSVDGTTESLFTWSLVTTGGVRKLVLNETRDTVVQPQKVIVSPVSAAAPGFAYFDELGVATALEGNVAIVVIDLSVAAEPRTQGLFDRVELRNR